MRDRYKVFDYTWHVPHQYDMIYALRDNCEFFYCLNTKKQWDLSQRPKPDNLHFVTHYEARTYDLAILHIDQQVIVPDNLKTQIYNEFDAIIQDIPKIVLNHGTPVYPERFMELGLYKLPEKEMERQCVEMVKAVIKDKPMIVNSHTAASASEWGFGIPVVHGMNPENWWDLPKEPRVFTALSPFGLDIYYNRGCMFQVSDILYSRYGYSLAYAKINIDTGNSPDDYKNYLGRSLIYLDTSVRTPMNRARTEAFLSGCCVVQVEGAHDLERWAKHGENIILVPDDPEEIARTVADLIENRYQEAVRIGQTGKKMALTEFSPERYRNDWLKVLKEVTSYNPVIL